VELEDGYRYRYWIIDINVTVEFITVTYERWMLIKKIDLRFFETSDWPP
jgi:hypothetical protein